MATRSLGTLTLDLIARIGGFEQGMDKAGRVTDKRMREMQKRAEDTGKAIGTALAGAAGAAVAAGTASLVMLKSTAAATGETDKWAKSLGISTQTLQDWQYAAERAGLSGDNMADIFKDIGDKIGDVLITNGGEAVEALNKLGLSAKALAGITPDQQLLAIAKGLEKVGTQAEKINILESLGNDLSRMLPLLDSGAVGFQKFAKQARDLNISMSPEQIENLTKANEAIKDLEAQFRGMKNEFVAGLADVDLSPITESMDQLRRTVTDQNFINGMSTIAGWVIKLASLGASAAAGIDGAAEFLASKISGPDLSRWQDVEHMEKVVASYRKELEDAKATGGIPSLFDDFGASSSRLVSDIEADLARAEMLLDFGKKQSEIDSKNSSKAVELPPINIGALRGHNGPDKAAEAAQKELNRQIKEAQSALKSLKDAYDPVGAAADDFAKQTAQVDLLLKNGKISQEEYGHATRWLAEQFNEAVDSATGLSQALQYQAELERQLDNDRQQYDLQAAAVGMGDKEADRARQRLDLERETSDKVLSLRTELATASTDRQRKALQDQIDLTNEYLPKQVAAMEEGWAKMDEAQGNWMNGARAAWENYADDARNYSAQAADFVSGTLGDMQSNLGDAFSDIATGASSVGDAFADMAANMAKSVISALADMAAQWLVYQAVQMMVGSTAQSSAMAGMVGNAQAASFQAQLNAYASTAGIPIVGPALAPAAAATAAMATAPMVAGVASAAMVGMAHDGMGNIPKEGTWLLDGGERVVAPKQNQDLTAFLARQSAVADQVSGGGAPSISISAPISVQGQPGMSEQQTQQQGETMGQAFTAEVIRIVQGEMRQGGVLWRRV